MTESTYTKAYETLDNIKALKAALPTTVHLHRTPLSIGYDSWPLWSFWSLTTNTQHLDFGNLASANMSPRLDVLSFTLLLDLTINTKVQDENQAVLNLRRVVNHPVLIISVDERRLEVSILIITFAGGKAFKNLHPKRQLHGVPIYLTSPILSTTAQAYSRDQ